MLVAPKPVSKDKKVASKSSLKRASMSSDGFFRTSRASKRSSSGVRHMPCSSRNNVLASTNNSLVIDDLHGNNFSRDLESFRELGHAAAFDGVQSSLFNVSYFPFLKAFYMHSCALVN